MASPCNSRKGVFSFLYIFAIFAYLIVIIGVYMMIYERISYLENKIFILEERAGREIELKHAVKRVIIYSEQIKSMKDQIKTMFPEYAPFFDSSYSFYGINKLNDLTSTGAHSYYHWRDFALRFWCGFPLETEIIDMIAIKGRGPEYFNSSRIYERSNVFDLDRTVIVGSEARNLCSMFLSSSMNFSTTITKPPKEIFHGSSGVSQVQIYDLMKSKYGIMVYDSKENVSSAVIIPESTEIIWDDYLGLLRVAK
ncbi:MAG: hypothetical protein N3G74_02080 [Candidatus Micrarchaeota archaeon]|nr:hypothetical protein [Candidatus Micrarchaeota archaeon]